MKLSRSPIVNTTNGPLEGCFEAGLAVFKGIPYASPPVGPLRWQPPQPGPTWTAVRPALQFGPSAPQNPSNAARFKEFVVEGPQSEDCLYLNIWTPALDGLRRPVMVWIHGGVFTMGSGSQGVFDGTPLAVNQNVVVVTLNYRLGLLGFLNLREITGGLIPACGNEGLLDQIAALQWLRDNIAAFGGDAHNITLFGESAGGTSIECLLCLPAARGLFHQAIMQSNIHQFIPLSGANQTSRLALQLLDVRPAEAVKLLELPVKRILAAQKTLIAEKSRRVFLAPVIDGLNLPAHPLAVFQVGKEVDIPVMIGTNSEETRLFQALRAGPILDAAQLALEVKILFPDQDPQAVIQAYRTSGSGSAENLTPSHLLAAIQTNLNFHLPALELIQARCRIHPRTFAYRFNWPSPALGGLLGACHGLEIGFIFGHYDVNFGGSGPRADRLSRQMQQAWAAFARNGNPTCPALGPWPAYCDKQQIMLIGARSRLENA
jgi:para-nitrobenzyl esterase